MLEHLLHGPFSEQRELTQFELAAAFATATHPPLEEIARANPADDRLAVASLFLQQTFDALMVRDSEDCIRLWNEAAERLYGWRAEEAIGRNMYDLLFPPGSHDYESQWRSLAQTGEWAGEMRLRTKSGRGVLVDSRWRLQENSSGPGRSIVIVTRDISEQKTLETQILHAQRVESLATIASAITHDLGNVLPAILLLMRDLDFSETDRRKRNDLESLQFQAEQAMRLITELLSLTRETRAISASVDLSQLIGQTEKLLKSAFPRTIKVKVALADGLPPVTGNLTHLHQALLNLCLNARDAMPYGGVLTLEGALVDSTEIDAARRPDATAERYIRITVGDTGLGIPPEIRERIFEPLFTTKECGKGSGLGLYSVARIIKYHKGFLDFSSAPGQGTRFSLYLPG